jgi:hypothetical protein
VKYVLPRPQMEAMRLALTRTLGECLPAARVLYWT